MLKIQNCLSFKNTWCPMTTYLILFKVLFCNYSISIVSDYVSSSPLHSHIRCLLWGQGGKYVALSQQSPERGPRHTRGDRLKEDGRGYIPTLSRFLQTTPIEKRKFRIPSDNAVVGLLKQLCCRLWTCIGLYRAEGPIKISHSSSRMWKILS